MLTDLLVSGVCLIAFLKLTQSGVRGRTHFYFKLYFLLMAIATFIGGVIGHGFLYLFSFGWKLPGWIISMCSVALIERSSIEHSKQHVRKGVGRFFLVMNIIELCIVMTITMLTLNFRWVEIHSGYGLLAVVLTFHGFVYLRTRDPGSGIIILAVFMACMAALVYMNQFSIHTWFNYLDISHTLMAIAAYIFYRGALRLRSEPSSSTLLPPAE